MHKPIAGLHDIAVLHPAPYQQHVLHRDYETRSPALLKNVGVHRYAADPRTEIICVAYAIDHDPVRLWIPGDTIPVEFAEAERNPDWKVAAHNDPFETAIEQQILAPRYGWPLIELTRHCCTMAMSLAVGLPARLSAAAEALELANRKDVAGERLMLQMSKPRKARKDEDAAGVFWFDDPERLQRLYSYCKQDVETERELYDRLPALSSSEHSVMAAELRNQRSRLPSRPRPLPKPHVELPRLRRQRSTPS